MLKKILIFALSLHASYILPTHFSRDWLDVGISLSVLVPGIVCTWLSYQSIKEKWQGNKEINYQIEILKEMGVEVSEGYKYDNPWRKHYINIKIPTDFSEQQQRKAKEHWDLLSTIYNKTNWDLEGLSWTMAGSLVLAPLGSIGIVGCIRRRLFDKN